MSLEPAPLLGLSFVSAATNTQQQEKSLFLLDQLDFNVFVINNQYINTKQEIINEG